MKYVLWLFLDTGPWNVFTGKWWGDCLVIDLVGMLTIFFPLSHLINCRTRPSLMHFSKKIRWQGAFSYSYSGVWDWSSTWDEMTAAVTCLIHVCVCACAHMCVGGPRLPNTAGADMNCWQSSRPCCTSVTSLT